MKSPEDTASSVFDGMSLGQAIVMYRTLAGQTQEDLAARSGVSVRTIQALESGASRSAQAGTARMLADALELGSSERANFIAAARKRPSDRERGIPADPDPILGRDAEIAAIEQRLDAGERLIILLGPGGVGKTRLARAVARRRNAARPGAVTWVGLESVTDPGAVLPAIAHALALGESGGRSLPERLSERLAERRASPPPLIVLDNFEHLLAAAPDVAGLLSAVPALRVLVTSRETLRLPGEEIVLLDPLPLPGPGESPAALAANPSVALFMRSLAAASPSRASLSDGAGETASRPVDTSVDYALAAGVVRLLDGLPLAIELAAAQGATLPLPTIRALLEGSGVAALSRGRRDAPGRFATMDAAVGWSADLLPADARRLFRLAGVFRGGFTAEAVAGVAAAAGAPGIAASLPLLAESQLIQPDRAAGRPRFRMLEPVRMVAAGRLDASGETLAVRRAHAGWHHRWAREQARGLAGPDPLPPAEALESDLSNVRAAIECSCDPACGDPLEALTTTAALSQFWEARGWFSEGRAALAAALAAAGPDAPLSIPLLDAAFWSGYLAYMQTDVPAIETATARFRPLAAAEGSPEYACRSLTLEILWRDASGQPPASLLPLAREAHALLTGQPREVAWHQSTVILANLYVQDRQYEAALPLLRGYRAWAAERGSLLHELAAMDWLGFALLRLGRGAEARELFTASLRANLRLGLVGTTINSLMGYVLAIAAETSPGGLEGAGLMLGALGRLVREFVYPVNDLDADALAETRVRIARALGEDRLDKLIAAGEQLTLDDIAGLVTD